MVVSPTIARDVNAPLGDVPVVLSGPYEYGTPGAPPVADLNPPTGVVSAAYAGADSARAEA